MSLSERIPFIAFGEQIEVGMDDFRRRGSLPFLENQVTEAEANA